MGWKASRRGPFETKRVGGVVYSEVERSTGGSFAKEVFWAIDDDFRNQ
jgi:hypothetical protein